MQVIFSKYTDLYPKEVLNYDAPELQRPDEEVVNEVGIILQRCSLIVEKKVFHTFA